jgi:methylated-DNA-[protein]-cysteine S-methyltransferase
LIHVTKQSQIKKFKLAVFSTYCHSPLGLLLIESNGEALIKVHFTVNDIQPAMPFGPTAPVADAVLAACVQQLAEYFEGHRTVFELPLAPQGTPFQQKVWHLLLQIPYAKQVSYMDMAKKTGDVKAIRAAASANGKNPVGIIIPCHRVIGSNQSLTGYAGGLWRKNWLLQHEARFGRGVQTLF